MKKLLIALIVLVLLSLVLLPAGIGLLFQSRAQERLTEDMPDARIDWQRGWTRSEVKVDASEWRADLRLRHAPLSPPGWLSGEGRVTLIDPPVAIDLRGRVTPRLGLAAHAEAPSIRLDGLVGWSAEQPRVQIEFQRNDVFRLQFNSAGVLGADGLGNRLAFSEGRLEIDVQPEDERYAQARVRLDLVRAEQPPSRLLLLISRIDRDALVRLNQSMEHLSQAAPNSAGASMATVGLVSAWGELAAAGLEINLESLVLDGEIELTGGWTPAARDFSLHGGGPADIALEWAAAVIGLDRALPPEQARAEARALLDLLTEQPGVDRVGGAIEVRLNAP